MEGDPDPAPVEANMECHITSSLGPMGRLLRRLHSLEASDHRLPEGLGANEIRLLKEGLEGLYDYLKHASEAGLDPSFTPKWWIKEVRELGYDTEDFFDEVMQPSDTDGVVVHRSAPRISTFRIVSKQKQRWPHNTEDFSRLMARVDDARERCQSFQLAPETAIKSDHGQSGISGHTPQLFVGMPVLSAPISDVYVDTASRTLVGVDEPIKKLVSLLAFGDDNQRQLKVVPISGSAGVGKTTISRTIYQQYGGQFQCRAFLRMSRNPDMRWLLTSILSQIKAPQTHAVSDTPGLINSIIKHLQGKRYFIVVDDLWTSSAWNIISRAFPYGEFCSRILTTTQIEDVALACSGYESECIFNIGPLNYGESRKLFFNNVFGSKDEGGCPKEFEVVADRIIKKSGGLPLSIINIASLLLPSKPNPEMEKWVKIESSLPSSLTTNSTSHGMKDILILIYNKLPLHLKTCLLYLSIYPEGYTIKKDDLVKQWVAESIVGDIEHGYFDELVRRGMIQPVDTNYHGEVLSCTVNHMVLDLIRYKSVEDNFIIPVNNFDSSVCLPDKVRRLSVQFGGAKSVKIPESIRMSQVRSLLYCGFFTCVPSIPDYGLLRVLILHIWADQDQTSFDLTIIGELFRLRYLKVECNITVNLPDKIQGLRYLETLQVDGNLSAVPVDIGHLEKLRFLGLPSQVNLRDLDGLTNLQDLHLTRSPVQPPDNLEDNMKYMGSILEKLSNLKSIILASMGSSLVNTSSMTISCDGLSNLSPALAHLERLELLPRVCIFPRLPKWFRTLGKLCTLKIAVREVSNSDTDIIKGLPALSALSLYIQTAPAERIVFGKAGFLALKYFQLRCSEPLLKFEADAMPNLRKLKLVFKAQEVQQHGVASICIENLAGLKEISIKTWGSGASSTESALRISVSNDLKIPTINGHLVKWNFYAGEDRIRAISDQAAVITEEQGEILEENIEYEYKGENRDRDLYVGDDRIMATPDQAAVITEERGEILEKSREYEYKEGDRKVDSRISALLESSPVLPRRSTKWQYGQNLLSVWVQTTHTLKDRLRATLNPDGLLRSRSIGTCNAGEFSGAVIQANNLLEDICRIESSSTLGTFVGIFDGHGGYEAAHFIFKHFFPNLQAEVTSSWQGVTTDTIRKAFRETEEGFIALVSSMWPGRPHFAAVGSCCLVGIVHQRTLFIANLGHSRALLGKVNLDGQITPEQLSSEHDVCHESVRQELMAQHPDDPQIVVLKDNVWRVKGFTKASRSIGDAHLKHQRFSSEPFSRAILSSNPSIISRNLEPSDRFIIFASDGLWELLSNEEAIEIVHKHKRTGIAKRLIKAALHEAARKHEMHYKHLKKIRKGSRRQFHDDITAIVLFIDYDLLVQDLSSKG